MPIFISHDEPSKGDFDRRGEAGGEEIGGQVGGHRQQLVRGTRSQLYAIPNYIVQRISGSRPFVQIPFVQV